MNKSSSILNKILFLIFIIIITNFSVAQQVKIKRIIDSNLFELTDGRLIKLAGVDVPNLDSKISNNLLIAKKAKRFSEEFLFNREVNFRPIIQKDKNSVYQLGILTKHYTTQSFIINIRYLKNGYGKFINNIDSIDTKKYLLAENESKRNKVGIWKFNNITLVDTLDRYLSDNSVTLSHTSNLNNLLNSRGKVKIKKILDSNLYELTDGSLIKLAGIDVPNINHKDVNLMGVGTEAYEFAKRMLLNRRFKLTNPKIISPDSNYILTQIIKEYPFLTRDFTNEFLERGLGKYMDNVDTSYVQKYLSIQNEAKNNREGIWEFSKDYSNDTLDQTLDGLDSNSIEHLLLVKTNKNIFANFSIPGRITIQLLGSPFAGGIFAVAGAGIEKALSSDCGHCWHGIFGAYIGYIVGTSSWAYIAGGGTARNLSYPLTLLAGATGAVLHLFMARFYMYDTFWYSLFFTPIISEIIYTTVAGSNDKNVKTTRISNNYFEKYHITYQDYYNSTKLFEVDLFRINF